MGRKRIYANGAERVAAHRVRQEEKNNVTNRYTSNENEKEDFGNGIKYGANYYEDGKILVNVFPGIYICTWLLYEPYQPYPVSRLLFTENRDFSDVPATVARAVEIGRKAVADGLDKEPYWCKLEILWSKG